MIKYKKGGSMEELNKLLDKLKFSHEFFDNGKLVQIKCNKDKTKFEFIIEVNTLTYKKYTEFLKRLKKYYERYTVSANFIINSSDITKVFNELYNEYLKEETLKQYKENKVIIENNNVTIEVANEFEKKVLKNILNEIKSNLNEMGYLITVDVIINEELSKQINNEIKNELKIDTRNLNQVVEQKEEVRVSKYPQRIARDKTLVVDEVDGVIKGRVIEALPILMKEIEEGNDITVEAKIFSTELIQTKTDLKIITIKMTDETDSLYGKMFIYDEDDANKIMKAIKNGVWYKIRGQVKYDEYAKELSMMIRDINLSDKVDETKKDDASIKRVELHAHTMMSQMDGIIDEVKLVKTAIKYGHKAVAITDHDSCQSFPHVYSEITKYNKTLIYYSLKMDISWNLLHHIDPVKYTN